MTQCSAQLRATDRDYVAGHRFMFGELGERVATAAILIRDTLMRPGFVLPVIRLAPVAPYGHCAALSGNSGALHHVADLSPGVWLYLHQSMYGGGERQLRKVDEVTLHELLHNELLQAGHDIRHRGEPWAARCQEMSRRLGLDVQIQRPRSIRTNSHVTTGTPAGCLPYSELARWPAQLLDSGAPLRARLGRTLLRGTS
jgi:hypothetical protein